ncbi:MAG: PIN domain-containing protein [Acidimicrobiales bacterium]
MKPADVPARPLLVDTNVVSQIVLREGRWEELAALTGARARYINFAVLGELATFTRMSGVAVEKRAAMTTALEDWEVLDEEMGRVAWEWARLRALTRQELTANDFERRQNDTWIAASALSYDPPLPIVTAKLDDFQLLAAANPRILLIHPDLG